MQRSADILSVELSYSNCVAWPPVTPDMASSINTAPSSSRRDFASSTLHQDTDPSRTPDEMSTKVVHDEPADGPLHFPDEDHLQPTQTMIDVTLGAKTATDKEHKMTLMQGIRLYPKAVFWSLLISTCICMEGYDVCLLSNFYGFPQFNKKYGVELADGTYQVPARWQAGLSNGANVGEIIGLFINGWVSYT